MQDKTNRPTKKAVNLSIEARLLAEAKATGLNLSAVLEGALRTQLKELRTEQWRAENRAAIEASNRYLEKHGLPLAKFRTW